MVATLDWITVVFVCVGVAAALVYWRVAQKTRRYLQQSRRDLLGAREELQEARRQLQELPTDVQLAAHLAALSARVVDCILILDAARIKSAGPYCRASEEAEQSRTISRQERFAQFRDELQKANIQISAHIERLLAIHPVVLMLGDSLKSGHFDPSVGRSDIVSIEAALAALHREVSPDDAWRDAIHKIRKEFDPILKARDRSNEIDRRYREEERVAAALAFSKYKLPPLTPIEKYRALKSGGHRDSFD